MLYAGLDLSRKRLDFHLLDGEGATVELGSAPPDADGLYALTRRLKPRPHSPAGARVAVHSAVHDLGEPL
jgi:transposase